MQTKRSKILDGYELIIIYPDDKEYNAFSSLFEIYGLALTDPKSNIVYVDGGAFDKYNLDNDHLTAIDAHEMSHVILNHGSGESNTMEEIEADYFAVLLLNASGYKESADILIDEFSDRHGVAFEDVENKISQETEDFIFGFMDKYFPDSDLMTETNNITREFFYNINEQKLDSVKQTLLEGRVEDAQKLAENNNIPIELFNFIKTESEKIGSNHKYLLWMLNVIIKNNITDNEKITTNIIEPLQYFNSHTEEFAQRDIYAYDDLADFQKIIEEVKNKERRHFEEINPGDLVYENSQIQIFVPSTLSASCKYGAGTTWCTTMADRDYYRDYRERGELYYVLDKTKSSSDQTNKLAIRFVFEDSETGYNIAEIRTTTNQEIRLETFIEYIGNEAYEAIIADLLKRHEIMLKLNTPEGIKELYEKDPKSILIALSFNKLFSMLIKINIIQTRYDLFALLIQYDIKPLTKNGVDHAAYFEYLLLNQDSEIDTINVFLQEYSEINPYSDPQITDGLLFDFFKFRHIVEFLKNNNPEHWAGDLIALVNRWNNNDIEIKGRLDIYFNNENIDFTDFWKQFNGLGGFLKYLNYAYDKIFRSIIRVKNYAKIAIYARSVLRSGYNILDVYNDLLPYCEEYGLDIFEIISPNSWIIGFKNLYGEENSTKELISFMSLNNMDPFYHLSIDKLLKYYESTNNIIAAAIEYYDDKVDDIRDFLSKKTSISEQMEYFKDIDKTNTYPPFVMFLNFYGEEILDYYDISDLVKEIEDIEKLEEYFIQAELPYLMDEVSLLSQFKLYYSKSQNDATLEEERFKYLKKAFNVASMNDVRLNDNGTVDLICGGWSDFIDWFENGGHDTDYNYVAEKIFSEDFWEPFGNVHIEDWKYDVWDNINDKNILEIRKAIKEKIIGDGIEINVEDLDINSDGITDMDENGAVILTIENLDGFNNDDLGKIINDVDDFSELKNVTRWTYGDAYNTAILDEYYEKYTDAIIDVINAGNPKWEQTGKIKTHRYRTPDGETKEYTSKEEVFVLPNISFFSLLTEWVDMQIDYKGTDEFEYSSFISTIQNLLSENDNLLTPRVDDWPDSDKVTESLNKTILDRLGDI